VTGRLRVGLLLVGCLGLTANRAVSQIYRSAADVIAVTVTVRDGDGHLVTNLASDAFELFEDGWRQRVTQFTTERVPVSFGILLDISDSMFGRRIQESRDAIEQFIRDRLDSEDEYAILGFNHQHRVLTAWTTDRRAAARVLGPVIPSGSTAIYDAVVAALPLVEQRTRQRAALVIISDGADTASDANMRQVRSALIRSEAFVYAIAIDPVGMPAINTRVNLPALAELTDQSGGRTLVVRSTSDTLAALAEIAEELDNQFLLGYMPPTPGDGAFHSIRVRIPGDYRVRARNGYVSEPLRRR
jgi:Ca-activated chloride channel family protein